MRKATKKKGILQLIKHVGEGWYANEDFFEIRCLQDEMVADCGAVPGRTLVPTGATLYLMLVERPPSLAPQTGR
jgi:hypothetical protein